MSVTGASWAATPHQPEHRLAATTAVLALIGIQICINQELVLSPQWLIPAVEVFLFLLLMLANPIRFSRESKFIRMAGLALIAAASVGTAWSVAKLVQMIVAGNFPEEPRELLLNGGGIWVMNVIVFGLWFWELDRGGPAARAHARHPQPDFLFPQMATPHISSPGWHPQFLDYVYVSFTNAAAFSPTDTMPLSRWAKITMLMESAIALAITALIVARAINILH